ncbi:MAG: hypothetical protein ACK5JD_14850, partial [Mangrovibacterium sp.]
MKTMKILGLAIALTVAGQIALATDGPKVELKPLEGKTAVLEVEQPTNKPIEITIQNKSGEVVYYAETDGDTNKYQLVYNFDGYKPGTYNMMVANNELVTEHRFTLTDGAVSVGAQQTSQKPFFAYNNAQAIIRVAYLNYPGEQVKLKVYDGNELIYNKALDNSFSVNEGLNLSKLAAGQYQIVLAAGNKKFDYPVIVDRK